MLIGNMQVWEGVMGSREALWNTESSTGMQQTYLQNN